MTKKKVLITYARNRIAYVSAKSLHQKGYEVHVADSLTMAMTFFSKYCDKKFIYPCPFKNEELFIKKLKDYIKTNKIDFLLPSHEEGFIISKHYKDLSAIVNILIPEYKTIEIANNKKSISEVVEKVGICKPVTYKFQNIKDFYNFLKTDVKFPLVIKLQKSRGSAGLCYVNNKSELEHSYLKILNRFNIKRELPIIQEYINGYGLGVSFLYNNGKMLAFFTHKRIIELPITGGFSVERISFRHKKAEEAGKKIMDYLKWNGVAMVEFRIDRKTGKPYFLEINPRFWGSLYQAIQSGVDFPFLVIKTLEGESFKIPESALGVRTRFLLAGFFVLPQYLKARRWKEVKMLLNVFNRKLYFDDFSIADPIPFLVSPLLPIINLLKRGKFTFETKSEEVSNFNN